VWLKLAYFFIIFSPHNLSGFCACHKVTQIDSIWIWYSILCLMWCTKGAVVESSSISSATCHPNAVLDDFIVGFSITLCPLGYDLNLNDLVIFFRSLKCWSLHASSIRMLQFSIFLRETRPHRSYQMSRCGRARRGRCEGRGKQQKEAIQYRDATRLPLSYSSTLLSSIKRTKNPKLHNFWKN
jgi:hypothetical protein